MRIFNRYIVILVISSGLINSLLALTGQNDLGIYFIVNIIAYMIVTLAYVHFNPRARMALNTISLVLFGGFLVVAALKTLEILTRK